MDYIYNHYLNIALILSSIYTIWLAFYFKKKLSAIHVLFNEYINAVMYLNLAVSLSRQLESELNRITRFMYDYKFESDITQENIIFLSQSIGMYINGHRTVYPSEMMLKNIDIATLKDSIKRIQELTTQITNHNERIQNFLKSNHVIKSINYSIHV